MRYLLGGSFLRFPSGDYKFCAAVVYIDVVVFDRLMSLL